MKSSLNRKERSASVLLFRPGDGHWFRSERVKTIFIQWKKFYSIACCMLCVTIFSRTGLSHAGNTGVNLMKGSCRTVTYLLNRHFITIFLIAGFAMKLRSQRRAGDTRLRYFWMTVISTIILVAADCLDVWARGEPDRRFLHLVFSMIGYVMRPTAPMSIAQIVYPKEKRPRYLWFPFILNALVYLTAFFSPVAYRIDESNQLVIGPMGLMVFSVCFFYIVFAVLTMWARFRYEVRTRDRFILYLSAASCLVAALIDWEMDTQHVNAAIMISSIFLYMFIWFYDTNRDPLTHLRNRLAFYEDCERYASLVTAVASVDMNGLKELNDSKGHEAGDEALKAIGSSLEEIAGRRIIAYRIGGDEFVLLYLRQDETVVRDTMYGMKRLVEEKGYSVSVGYSMRSGREDTVSDMLQRSDEWMYKDKAVYYKKIGRDRRTRE